MNRRDSSTTCDTHTTQQTVSDTERHRATEGYLFVGEEVLGGRLDELRRRRDDLRRLRDAGESDDDAADELGVLHELREHRDELRLDGGVGEHVVHEADELRLNRRVGAEPRDQLTRDRRELVERLRVLQHVHDEVQQRDLCLRRRRGLA